MQDENRHMLLIARVLGASVVLSLLLYVIAAIPGLLFGLFLPPIVYGLLVAWSKHTVSRDSSKLDVRTTRHTGK